MAGVVDASTKYTRNFYKTEQYRLRFVHTVVFIIRVACTPGDARKESETIPTSTTMYVRVKFLNICTNIDV